MQSLSLPQMPGITFRGYQGPKDVPALLAVHAACRTHDTLDPHSVCYRLPFLSPEKYAEQINQSKATLIAEVDGNVVAHGFMEAWGHEERLYLWRVWVRPEFRGRGLGTCMHRWGEDCARHLHGTDTRAAMHLANATEGEVDASTLLQNEGYFLSFISPELAFDIGDGLPLPEPPQPIILRPLEADSVQAVARALSEANLMPPGHEELFNEKALEAQLAAHADEWNQRIQQSDAALSVVAWDGAQVVGAYLCRRAGDVGEISQVAVRAPWRNRGIARALAMQSLHNLHSVGCVTARLFTSAPPDGVETTDGPYAMYRKFGFYPIARHLRFRKPMLPASK